VAHDVPDVPDVPLPLGETHEDADTFAALWAEATDEPPEKTP
jgi:hypothetical protein